MTAEEPAFRRAGHRPVQQAAGHPHPVPGGLYSSPEDSPAMTAANNEDVGGGWAGAAGHDEARHKGSVVPSYTRTTGEKSTGSDKGASPFARERGGGVINDDALRRIEALEQQLARERGWRQEYEEDRRREREENVFLAGQRQETEHRIGKMKSVGQRNEEKLLDAQRRIHQLEGTKNDLISRLNAVQHDSEMYRNEINDAVAAREVKDRKAMRLEEELNNTTFQAMGLQRTQKELEMSNEQNYNTQRELER